MTKLPTYKVYTVYLHDSNNKITAHEALNHEFAAKIITVNGTIEVCNNELDRGRYDLEDTFFKGVESVIRDKFTYERIDLIIHHDKVEEWLEFDIGELFPPRRRPLLTLKEIVECQYIR